MRNKGGKTRGFRPRGQTEKRIEFLERLGVNISDFVNEVLDNAMEPFYKEVAKRKEAELRKVFGSAP